MAEPEVLSDPSSTEDASGRPGEPKRSAILLLRRLNKHGFRLVMLADCLGLYLIAVGVMLVRFGTDWPSYPVWLYLGSFVVVVVVFLASLYFGGLYEREPRLGAPPVLPRAARQTLAAGGLVALLTLVLTGAAREVGLPTALELPLERALPFPILNLVVLIVVGATLVATNRRMVHVQRTRREGPPKVILVGEGAALDTARRHVGEDEERANIVAELEDPSRLLDTVDATGATDVLLLTGEWLDHLYPATLKDMEGRGIPVLMRVTARETMFGLERVREVGGLPFVLLRSQTMPLSRERFKRFFDVSLLAMAAVLWLPVLALVAVYQAVVAGRPLLYWQERVGAGGQPFRMVKFRTMRTDAEDDGKGARLAERDDPRVIPACRWIRSSRMDELPQLWNVLKGEMSVVGPRPERPELTEAFDRSIPGYSRRHEVPPGLTGLAQIHGRYHTDAEYKLGYDLQYLVNWSPVLDLEILGRTVWVILARRI